MEDTLLIVEDQFIEANNLKIILLKADYHVLPIARSVDDALAIIDRQVPDLVLLDIFLKGERTGIDLAHILKARGIAFVYLSANSDKSVFTAAKMTGPYGFLIKPFRERDVLAMLDIAWYHHSQKVMVKDNEAKPKKTSNNPVRDRELKKIVGESGAIQALLKNVETVADTNVPVLLLGESGTGKELIAKFIHELSERRSGKLIVVDCAAMPPHLVESELFGHEKGSFTGATEKRIGKFEQADGGTVFLDEIGELPLDLQVKFLRVLQEMEIEPIGGKRKKVNIRILAATNRNLEEEMANGRFRMDLYYRLNIFPINLPALRDRKSDIMPLAVYFLEMNAAKFGKNITGFSDEVRQTLTHYDWPGNVRELENLIIRAILLCHGNQIGEVQVPGPSVTGETSKGLRVKTMTESERDHILAALRQCNWKIYGPGGAAELLAINGSTLKSRMKKLGI
ncbi:DNA-binding transcriptional response regulator, NtrC family, contains REC, AAA-type ATPase, and a Fis-type DNA-binding domains [Dyadobacter soli]|uniref:DNA-binding transcriptional response regulator, NtrC family, contains REC, AAA-type ATPase, and a Fis-type DNA-binding domains n=1 Tax=Dyadobacter soli TaxID=659014 RepID=A0A1G7MES3_9BACT|nr:sigma-54 dependent transcriptional regulator [Dyadobacter soli]SDF60166.1 DNA-binding transcriptional response regulator, NtrC family, contains REC, AAA-type ATPase, and a Fis-type DNA-binding domains [Dyadobacter soli]